MQLDRLYARLIAAARLDTPSDHVPYAFEQRVLACLGGRRRADAWTAWSALLWRAVLPCAAIMLLAGVGSVWVGAVEDLGTDLGTDLELADLGVTAELP